MDLSAAEPYILGSRQVLRITVMNPRTRRADGEAILDGIAGLAAGLQAD